MKVSYVPRWRECEGRCSTRVPATECAQAEDGAWLCRECADAEHAEREALEGDGRPVAINEAEEWR